MSQLAPHVLRSVPFRAEPLICENLLGTHAGTGHPKRTGQPVRIEGQSGAEDGGGDESVERLIPGAAPAYPTVTVTETLPGTVEKKHTWTGVFTALYGRPRTGEQTSPLAQAEDAERRRDLVGEAGAPSCRPGPRWSSCPGTRAAPATARGKYVSRVRPARHALCRLRTRPAGTGR
ncbi:hypothetical protein ALMP_62430 [Streptomyces sp. A012304]|nr:hypothetical protein ALMP_62430 [Streptomyces sp. A012304]